MRSLPVCLIAAAAGLSACAQTINPTPSIAEEPVVDHGFQLASLTPSAFTDSRPPVATPRPHPRPKAASPLRTMPPRYNSVGVASWYGPNFHGRLTANGEIYDMNALTAAHRSLPFGTEIEVTNLANNQSLTLVVNDRGPYIDKRVIDVSYKAAVLLGFVDDGLADVKIVQVE